MELKTDNTSKKEFRISIGLMVPIIVALLALAVIPTYAWLAKQRSVAAVGKLDMPAAIYIHAAHKEDIELLDLSGLDMTRSDGQNRYNKQLFAFTVYGEYVDRFRLQLAYTTNNQFEYKVYQAIEHPSNDQPSGTDGIDYVSFNVTSQSAVYYTISGSALSFEYANLMEVDGEKLGKTNDDYYTATYSTFSPANDVNKYAVPIYCQTESFVRSIPTEEPEFVNFFILEVDWDNDKGNDRETDIVYIAAMAD